MCIRDSHYRGPWCTPSDSSRVYVLALPGASSWKPEWAEYARGRPVILALDNDAAGEAAVARMTPDLEAAGATKIERLLPPAGQKDWGGAPAIPEGEVV